MQVFRIENDIDHRGLYRSYFTDSNLYRELEDIPNDSKLRPSPLQDRALKLADCNGPEDLGWSDVHFGFADKKQILNWFGADEWERLVPLLEQDSFHVVQLEVPETHARKSSHQVIFDPGKAKVIKVEPVKKFRFE